MNKNKYYESLYKSQSFLKAVIKGPEEMKIYEAMGEKDFDLKKYDSMAIGSAVDCKMTTPAEWDNEYLVSETKAPADDLVSILKEYRNTYKYNILQFEALNSISLEENYGKEGKTAYCANIKDPVKREARLINAETEAYYRYIIESETKTILDNDRMEIVDNCVETLGNSYTKHFFDLEFDDRFKVEYQVALMDEETENKGLLDMVVTNISEFNIELGNGYIFPAKSTTIFDIKTGAYQPHKLKEYIYKWKIYFQMSWYQMLYSLLFKETRLNMPVILYAHQTKHDTYSTWYEFNENELALGGHGGRYDSKQISIGDVEGKNIFGYKDGLKKLEQYHTQQQFDIDCDVFENNGKVKNQNVEWHTN